MGRLRLPAGESSATRLHRVEAALGQLKGGRQGSNKLVVKCLVEYRDLLQKLWWWQVENHK